MTPELPSVLLPYQQRWIADPSPFKVAEKGRRTGLTWAEASDDVLIAAADKAAGGQNVYYIGQDKDMTEEYIDACAMWAREFNQAAASVEQGLWDDADDEGNSKSILTYTIRFPKSRHRITALASRPKKLRGRQGVLVGDEAAFQDDLDGLIKAAMAFLIWGGKVRLISTHFGVDNPFNTLVNDIRSGKQMAPSTASPSARPWPRGCTSGCACAPASPGRRPMKTPGCRASTTFTGTTRTKNWTAYRARAAAST